MSIFTIYNPVTKEVAEEKFFEDYTVATKYAHQNYPKGFIAEHEPFHFTSRMRSMLNEGKHKDVLTDKYGAVAIVTPDEVFHCGGITMNDISHFKMLNIKLTSITKVEFIKLHNSLIK